MNLGQAVTTFMDRVFGLIITISPVEIKVNKSLYKLLKAVYMTKKWCYTLITDLHF